MPASVPAQHAVTLLDVFTARALRPIARALRQGARRAISKTPWRQVLVAGLSVVLIVGAAVGVSVGHRAFFADAPRSVHLVVEHAGSVNLRLGIQKDGGVTPTCGCKRPQGGRWRGVTFVGRSITLGRSGSSPWTEWVLSAPEEDHIELTGDLRRLRVDAFRIPDNTSFHPRRALAAVAEHPEGWIHQRVWHRRLKLLNHGVIHVALLGHVPVGSWIPMPGSRLALTSQPSNFPQRPGTLVLREDYGSALGQQAKPQVTRDQGYPLGDFLGPPMVIWSDDPTSRIPGTRFAKPAARKITALVLRDSTFAVRLAAIPLSTDERRFLLSDGPSSQLDSVLWSRSDHGTVQVTVKDLLNDGQYRALRARVVKNPKVDVNTYFDYTAVVDDSTQIRSVNGRDLVAVTESPYPPIRDVFAANGGDFGHLDQSMPDDVARPAHGSGSIEDYFPPLPAHQGFNVYGPITGMTLNDATGSVRIGSQHRALEGEKVAIAKTKLTADGAPRTPAPIPLTTSERRTELTLDGVGRVAVGEKLATSFAAQHPGLPDSTASWIGILTALAAALGASARLGRWLLKGRRNGTT